jgi:hypothetical protein
MKKIIISLVLCFQTQAFSSNDVIEPSDYIIPELDIISSKSILRSFHFKENLNETFQLISRSLRIDKSKSSKEMRLTGFNMQLGLGLKGGIGLLTWGGAHVGQIFWGKRHKKNNYLTESFKKTNINLNDYKSHQELNSYFKEFNVSGEDTLSTEEKDFIREFLLKKTQWITDVTSAARHSSKAGWNIDRILFDMSLALEVGVPAALLTKMGGDVRIRFEWKKIKDNQNKIFHDKIQPMRKDLETILNAISSGVNDSSKERNDLDELGLELNHIRVEINKVGKANLGIFKGSAGLSTYLYIRPPKGNKLKQNFPSDGSINLIVQENVKVHEVVAEKYGVGFSRQDRESIFKIKKNKFAKSLKKTFRFARKLGKPISDFSKKKNDWNISKVRTTYAISASGDIGAVTLGGNSSVELEFKNLNF